MSSANETNATRRQLTRRVFISSTSVDLRAHRERVRDTLLSLGLFPLGMESFGAQGTGDATSVSVDQLTSCDVYLGIYAWRYGTVPPGMGQSVTHQEYEEATRLGMPRYIFLADPTTDAPQGPNALFPASVRDAEHRAQLDAFRAEVGRTHVVDFFTTPEDLAARVATALGNYLLKIQREELTQAPRPPHDLPPRAPGFLGRERELAALCSALRRGQETPAVALVGMAGAGKSALAAEVIYTLASDAAAFPGGVTWVRCDGRAGLPGLAWIEDQVLSAWGIDLSPDELARATNPEHAVEVRERALRRRLGATSSTATQPALLLLDNVEHDLPITRAIDTLTPLGVHLLLTARHEPSASRLRLVPLDVLDPAPAAELLAERYAARGGEWDAARDRPAAAEVVEALGRLPMAIELAAARAARLHQGIAALAEELREADRLGKLRDPLEPTHSVRYAFSRSLELLTPKQRACFTSLGLPAGPDWPRPVIEQLFAVVGSAWQDEGMASVESGAPADDLDTLSALSLLTVAGGEAGSRVRLHPLLRDLAREEWQRVPAEERIPAVRALLLGIGDLVAAEERDFAALARDEDLIVGAIDVAAEAQVEPATVVAAIAALEPYFDLGGHWQLGFRLTGIQRYICRESADRAGEARALNNLGVLAQRLGDLATAQGTYDAALALRRELGDRAGQAETLSNLGGLAHARGALEAAQASYRQALEIRREVGDRVGDRRGEGTVLHNLGSLSADMGRQEEARALFEQALAIRREVNDQAGEGVTLNNLGGLAVAQGRLDEARALFEQALAAERAAGDRVGEGTTLNNLGGIARTRGETALARELYQQALVIRRAIGDTRGEGTTLHNLGVLAQTEHDEESARDLFTQALVAARAAGDRAGEMATINNLGLLARARHELELAQGYYTEALAIARELADQAGEGLALTQLGELAQARARFDEAAAYYEQALAIRHALGDQRGEGLILNNLGMLAYARGKPAEAAERFRQAVALLEASGAEDSARIVRANLEALAEPASAPAGPEPVLPAAPIPPAPGPADAMPDPSSGALAQEPSDELSTRQRRRWLPWSR
jgi:tetratricopeptide (TPR) repeat protein